MTVVAAPPPARGSLFVLVGFLTRSTPAHAIQFGWPTAAFRASATATARVTSTVGAVPTAHKEGLSSSLETGNRAHQRTTGFSRRRRPSLPALAAAARASNSPPPEVLNSQDLAVKRNLARLRQVTAVGEMSTIKAITSSALRSRLRLSGKDKRGRVFLPGNRSEASFETLGHLLKETFPIGNFPVAVYVKTYVEGDQGKIMVTSDEQLRHALGCAEQHGVNLNIFLDLHPDYREEEPPDWLVDVPDPALADEWEMLSFYRFVEIDQPEAYANVLQRSWEPLGVRGRVYVASEGINAQMAVPSTSSDRFEIAVAAVDKLAGVYLNKADRRWSAEEFSSDPPFPALHVRARKQIVADGLPKPLEWSDSSGRVGKGLSPEEWHEMLGEEGSTVIDCRNAYESEVGTFESAIPLDTSFFRESWGELERLVGNADRDAPIMTYCTGGIRCVKVAAYLEQEMGFRNVTRLEGGIVSYSKFAKEQGLESKFKGVNYVFDKRMGDKVTGDMLSTCHQCGEPCADHTNCANSCCHARFIQCASCATKYEACCSSGCVEQHSRPDLRQSILLAEREAMGFGGAISTSMEMSGGRDGNGDIYGDGDEDIGVDGGEKERRELMWLIWPFQDPSLNLMFDRAFEEFLEGRPKAKATEDDEEAEAEMEPDSSRMIGIVSRLGGGKRALAVGLGAGGAAGRNALRRLAEALGEGGELVAAEESAEAAAAARGLSMVSGVRGCSVTVMECEEASIINRLLAEPVTPPAAAIGGVEPAAIPPPPQGLFDVILLGGGGSGGGSDAAELAPVGTGTRTSKDVRGERKCWDGAGRSSAERLDLVLDKRLIKRRGLVLCDPAALSGGEKTARSLAARALEVRGTIEHARVPGAGPVGGLHIFKWKTYSH